MQLSQKAIEELKEIHKNITGEELSDKEACEMEINIFNISPSSLKKVGQAWRPSTSSGS